MSVALRVAEGVKVVRGLVLLVLLTLVMSTKSSPATAVEIEFSSHPVRREIIALYDSSAEARPGETRIHRFAEMPLNWLGYVLVYQDINSALPDAATLRRYHGVISWFLEPIDQPETVARWLDEATREGLRYVVIGEPAPPLQVSSNAPLSRVFERLGLRDTGQFVEVTYDSKVAHLNKDLIGFERPVDRVLPDYGLYRRVSNKTAVHLSIEPPASAGGGGPAVIVSTGPGGGVAQSNYVVFYEPTTEREVWIVNPFRFFRLAFGDEIRPIPDVTTVSGRRVYFSHIDGDGWNNLTEIEGYREKGVSDAEVVLKEAIAPYPDLPVTIGVIGGDADPSLGGRKRAQRVAEQLYRLPQVEVAAHTYTHPYNWRFFESYERTAEEAAIARFQVPALPVRERATRAILNAMGTELPAPTFDKYVAGTDDLPRTYLRKPFDTDKEVAGALRLAESFAPPGKTAKVYLWSGDTTPFEAAIRATRRAGVRNLNGGDSRLDHEYPSVSYVPAISRMEGGERQIYAANSNENTYTNDWTGPYYGFFLLEETLRNTELPRRLKPFNLYYHMYSGEKPAALAAVKYFLDLARRSDVVPVPASHYAAMADDFFSVQVEQADVRTWFLSKLGSVETVRFDEADNLDVDFVRSRAVLGSRRHAGALYVSLDSAAGSATVSLKPTASTAADRDVGLPMLSLEQARWRVYHRQAHPCAMTFTAQGYGAGHFVWRTRPRAAVDVQVARGATTLSEEVVWADAEGRLKLSIDADARTPLTVRLSCHE